MNIDKKKIENNNKNNKWFDVSIPGEKMERGHLHPLTQVLRKTEEIFHSMGFSIIQGPELELEWYNFDALNMPKDHPARDMQDTLWIKEKIKNSKEGKKLMRTQTSAVQVRYMEKNNPPFRIIVPGRVFRHEATDPSHEVQFYQLEGMMVDKEISLANLSAVIDEFLKRFFDKKIETRLRPSYFPFTEPSVEIDIKCINCKGKGCSTCQQAGWLEIIPGGMIHPNVFKAAGYNPKNWKGFAFGMGIDRLAMMKYKINDIRLFYSGDLRFLKQF